MMVRPVEDKGCDSNVSKRVSNHRTALGKKPAPSKWDDAQKWLVGLNNQSKTAPRNSNADDLRLIAPVPQKEQDYSSGDDDDKEDDRRNGSSVSAMATTTKNVDSIWRIDKPTETAAAAVRSICVRDMGTDMTPTASVEASRAATPVRARTAAAAAARSPITSGSSTPARIAGGDGGVELSAIQSGEELNGGKLGEDCGDLDQVKKMNSLETRAMAWDEAERAKYMARFKREEVKIQAWENHEKRKAEMEMRKIEVKADRMKARAQEKMTNKLAATRRMAEEKRANAEAKLNEKAVKTSEKSDYVKRTGHLPSSFSFKLPSLCWSQSHTPLLYLSYMTSW